MPIQECPLCLKTKPVVMSHLMSAALYDYCRKDGISPVRIGEGVVRHTDRQIQAYLLCLDCEDILNKGGEGYMVDKFATIQRTFPLYDMVRSGLVAYEDPRDGEAIYYTKSNSEIDVQLITHFALGIFWKAGVHSWSGSGQEPMIDLEPYTETMRTWLLGQRSLPRNVILTITLCRPERAQIVLMQPAARQDRGHKRILMHLPGAVFILSVGEEIPIEMRMSCFYSNPVHPILISDQVIGTLELKLATEYRESKKTPSYLRSKAKRRPPSSA